MRTIRSGVWGWAVTAQVDGLYGWLNPRIRYA